MIVRPTSTLPRIIRFPTPKVSTRFFGLETSLQYFGPLGVIWNVAIRLGRTTHRWDSQGGHRVLTFEAQPHAQPCDFCGRHDGLHYTWGLDGDLMQNVRCAGGGRKAHCPNTAPIGGGGYCGPCRWG